jgi:hypothetical protein
LACYGLWLPARERMRLRFVDGRPVSPVTCAFLAWAAEPLAAEGVRVLALIGDNASWPISQEVRDWIRKHNREVKRTGQGCRLLPLANAEPVAEGDRAQMGAWQACGGRARAQARCRGTQAAALRALPISAPAVPRTTGRVIMH